MKKIAAILTLLLLVATSASAMILAGVLSNYRASQAPNAPTGVTATAGNTQNTVSWIASAVDGTHDAATNYTLYGGTSASPTSSIYSGSATSYTHTGLTNGTPYYYRLAANNSGGTSGYSSEVTATPYGGFTDTFTATNGSAPSSANWPTIRSYADGTLYTGSTGLTIQSNMLNYHSRLGTATDHETQMFAGSTPFANGRSVQVDFKTSVATNADNKETQRLFICGQSYAPNGNGFFTTNALIVYINRTASAQNLQLFTVDNSGNLTILYTTAPGSAAVGTVKMLLTDSTHVQLFIGGSLVGTFAHTATIGTTITPGLHVTTAQTAQFTDFNFDNFIVQ